MHFSVNLVWLFLIKFIHLSSGQHINEIRAPNASEIVPDELIIAHVINRHGDRNINSVYPNDPYKSDRYWPEGIGALTEIGKQQAHEFGEFLRRRYIRLIGTTYSSDKVYFLSSDRERTIENAAWVAVGLFPQLEVDWNAEIHRIASSQDHLLYPRTKCAKFSKLWKEYLESRKAVDIWKKHRSLISFIEKNSGKRLRSFADIASIYDILYVEHLKGFRLPEWANKALRSRQTLEYLVGIYLESYTHTTELKQLKAGYLIEEILDHFYGKTKSLLHPDRNLWVYSAHDTTIAIILNALNLYDMELPPYLSSLHFELYRRDHDDYYVQIIYRKSATDSHPRPLNIPNCGTKCPLDDFYSLYKHILPTSSFASACKIK